MTGVDLGVPGHGLARSDRVRAAIGAPRREAAGPPRRRAREPGAPLGCSASFEAIRGARPPGRRASGLAHHLEPGAHRARHRVGGAPPAWTWPTSPAGRGRSRPWRRRPPAALSAARARASWRGIGARATPGRPSRCALPRWRRRTSGTSPSRPRRRRLAGAPRARDALRRRARRAHRPSELRLRRQARWRGSATYRDLSSCATGCAPSRIGSAATGSTRCARADRRPLPRWDAEIRPGRPDACRRRGGPALHRRVPGRARGALSESALRAHLTLPHAGRADEFEQQASARQSPGGCLPRAGVSLRARRRRAGRERGSAPHRVRDRRGPAGSARGVGRVSPAPGPCRDAKPARLTSTPRRPGRSGAGCRTAPRSSTATSGCCSRTSAPRGTLTPRSARSRRWRALSDDRSRVRVTIPRPRGAAARRGVGRRARAALLDEAALRAAGPLKAGDAWDAERARRPRGRSRRLYAAARVPRRDRRRGETHRTDGGIALAYRGPDEGAPPRARLRTPGPRPHQSGARQSRRRGRDLPFREGDLLTPDRALEGQRGG